MKYLFSFLLLGIFPIFLFAQTQLGSDIDGEAAGDSSGYSVSLSNDGTILAIGAPYNQDNGSWRGHVRVYQYNSGMWSQLGSDIDGEVNDVFSGYSIALSDNGAILAIGATSANGAESAIGRVKVYQYSSGMWSQLGSDIDGEARLDFSGHTVSLSDDGTVLAIGAPYNDGNGVDAGHVRVYQYNSGSWSQLGGDIDGEAAEDFSGGSISLSGDGTILAIGAAFNDGNGVSSGHVRVYQYNTGAWSQIGNDIDGDIGNSGYSVSLSDDGNILAIGTPFSHGNGNYSGHARVYQYNSGFWSQLGSDIDGEAAGDQSAGSVSLSDDGTILVIAAAGNDGNGNLSGNVRVYQYRSEMWSQLGSDIDGEAAEDQSGSSVSLSDDGTVLAIGAPLNDGNGIDAGHVRVFDIRNLVEIEDISKEKILSVFPNPSKRNVTLTFDESLIGSTYIIYNQIGKEVFNGKLDQQNISINLEDLASGAYTLSIKGNYNQSLKLMKLSK